MDVRFKLLFATAVLLCSGIVSARAQVVVYSENFETRGTFPEWSTTATDPVYQNPIRTDFTPKGGRRFLGQFGAQVVTLQLANLPQHDTVVVEFDWFIIGSMDGTDPFYAESFAINETTAGFTYCTSFSNFGLTPPEPQARQAFPGQCGEDYPAETGAAERRTLGYRFDRAYDAVYRMRLVIPHTGSALRLVFVGYNLQQLYDESWGLDNMKITLGKPGIAARSLRFEAYPCTWTPTDTVWVHSTGSAPLRIDSATIVGDGAFALLSPVLPADVPPGDSIPMVVQRQSVKPELYTAMLSLFSNAEPNPLGVELHATVTRAPWGSITQKTPCGEPAYIFEDSCGIDSVTLDPGGDNVRLEVDGQLPAAYRIGVRIRLIDPARSGHYTVYVNGRPTDTDTIYPSALLDAPMLMPAAAFGTDGCGTVTLHNRESAGMWVNSAYLHHNLSFSVPPSQLPLWIPAGESRELMVCYRAGTSAVSDTADTLYLAFPCGGIAIALQSPPRELFVGEAGDCGDATIVFRQAGATKPVVLAHAPVLERDGTGLSILIEEAVPRDMLDQPMEVQVYDLLGRPVCPAVPAGATVSIRGDVRQSQRTYRADLAACAPGAYVLVVAAPGGPIVRPFMLVR